MSEVPNDPSFVESPLFAAAHPEIGIITTHGYSGGMTAVPPVSEVQKLYRQTGGLILESCFAGASYGGMNNAGRIATAAGVPLTQVYGCSGFQTTTKNALYCDGQWLDGYGREIPAANRGPGLLLNCKVVKLPPQAGQPDRWQPTGCY
jgi:hypothetical protein